MFKIFSLSFIIQNEGNLFVIQTYCAIIIIIFSQVAPKNVDMLTLVKKETFSLENSYEGHERYENIKVYR